MKGKISKIKDTKGELALPITTVEAVYMGDGTTKLSDEIKDVLRCEVFDDEGITVEISSVVEEIDGIKKDISEINSSLDNIEDGKATKQEVDVERKRIDDINSSLDTKANKSEVDNNINELDVKIAENKSLTDSEIARLREIANTWEVFKASGGEISGNLSAIQLATKSPSNNYRWAEETHDTGYKIISSNTNPSTGDWREEFIMAHDGFAPKNDKVLGTSENPWNDIYLKGVSKSKNGYTKLPNGLIMQWGYVTIYQNTGHAGVEGFEVAINFPISFPTMPLSISCLPGTNHYDVHKIIRHVFRYDTLNNNGVSSYVYAESDGIWHVKVFYVAIGY